MRRSFIHSFIQSAEHWRMLLTELVLEDVIHNLPETAPDRIAESGIQDPYELLRMESRLLCGLLDCDHTAAQEVKNRCCQYSWTVRREEVLARPLDARPCSIDFTAYGHKDVAEVHQVVMQLKYCKWQIEQELQDFWRSLPPAPQIFLTPDLSPCHGATGKPAVRELYNVGVVQSTNCFLRYDAHQGNAPPYELQHPRRGSITEREMKAIKAMPKVDQRHCAITNAKQQAGIKRNPDWSLIQIYGPDRMCTAVGECKRVEQLLVFVKDGEHLPDYAMNVPVTIKDRPNQFVRTVYAPDVLYLLDQAGSQTEQQNKTQKDLREDVERVVKQVAQYCKDFRAKYAFFGNYYYTWGFKLEDDTAYITQAVPCTATNLSTPLLVYYICTKGLEDARARDAAALDNQGHDNTAGSTDTDLCGNDGMDEDGSGGSRDVDPAGPRRSARLAKRRKAQQQPAAEVADVLVTCNQQRAGLISDRHAARAAARLIDLDLVQGYLATGCTGFVFAYKMPDGRPAALKVADPDSDHTISLRKEAVTLLALQPEWGKCVAGLLAAGIGKDGHSSVLAVECIPNCSHLVPTRERDVLPQLQQALHAVHSHGVAHQDIQCEHILVQRLADGSKKVWLIGWGCAVRHATPEQQQEDQCEMDRLFGITYYGLDLASEAPDIGRSRISSSHTTCEHAAAAVMVKLVHSLNNNSTVAGSALSSWCCWQ